MGPNESLWGHWDRLGVSKADTSLVILTDQMPDLGADNILCVSLRVSWRVEGRFR